MSTPPPEFRVFDHTERYYLALGQFIDKFAQVEKMLALTLWIRSKVTPDVARAVFSGVRADGATGYITRVLTVTNADQATKDEYQSIFTQIGLINAARNSIVHYGTEFNDTGEYVTSNRFVALTIDRLKETPVSADILYAMTLDLEKILMHLIRALAQTATSVEPEWLEKMVGPYVNAPWRYTPPPQASQRDKSPAKLPKP